MNIIYVNIVDIASLYIFYIYPAGVNISILETNNNNDWRKSGTRGQSQIRGHAKRTRRQCIILLFILWSREMHMRTEWSRDTHKYL
jgi:hypothetical protein